MTAIEYLSQARRFDDIINCRLRELEYWREMSCRISGGSLEQRCNPNHPTEAPFVRCLDRIDEIERDIGRKVSVIAELRNNINKAIDSIENPNERILLRSRYLENRSWTEIGGLLNVSKRTVHRIHRAALENFSVPI